MSKLGSALKWVVRHVKGNPVVALFAAATVAMESVSRMLGNHDGWEHQVAYIGPLVLAFLARYMVVPWSTVKELVEVAATATGEAEPQYKNYADAIKTAILAVPVNPPADPVAAPDVPEA